MKDINKMTVEELQDEYQDNLVIDHEETLQYWKQAVSGQRLNATDKDDDVPFLYKFFAAPIVLIMLLIEGITGYEFFKEKQDSTNGK